MIGILSALLYNGDPRPSDIRVVPTPSLEWRWFERNAEQEEANRRRAEQWRTRLRIIGRGA